MQGFSLIKILFFSPSWEYYLQLESRFPCIIDRGGSRSLLLHLCFVVRIYLQEPIASIMHFAIPKIASRAFLLWRTSKQCWDFSLRDGSLCLNLVTGSGHYETQPLGTNQGLKQNETAMHVLTTETRSSYLGRQVNKDYRQKRALFEERKEIISPTRRI